MVSKTYVACALAGAVVLGTAWRTSARQDGQIAYPGDFRAWTHVKSTLIGTESPGFAANGGLHHYYANQKGVEGYRTGTFPDGAILIDDLLETKAGNGAGVTVEGARRRLAVMVKDSRKYPDTGGWGFEVFKADTESGSLSAESRTACFTCHQKPKNGVFTQLRK